MRLHQNIIFYFYFVFILQFISCKSAERPYNYKKFPKTYNNVINDHENYNRLNGCKQGETIASIGAGNGIKEVQISCFVEGISWYLEEIDSSRLFEFPKVLKYHEQLKGTPINADFKLVLGTETTTKLPHGVFDRVLMINVFHEIETRENLMMEIHSLLKNEGELVIMERMAKAEGEVHGDCKLPRLYEDNFLKEMDKYGFKLTKKILGEELSNLTFFTFVSNTSNNE